MAALKRFHVEGAENGFSLQIEDDSGTVTEMSATREQLDVLVDSLDELLSSTEADDEVDDTDAD